MRIILAAVAGGLLLTGCATTGTGANLNKKDPPKVLAPAMPGYTKNLMVRAYDGFNPDGTIRPWRPLTLVEARMVSSASAQCADTTKEVYDFAVMYARNGVKGGIIQGLFMAMGAAAGGFLKGPAAFGDYLAYGGIAGVGSGLFAADQQISQMLAYTHAYCVTLAFDRNSRDRDVTRLGGVAKNLMFFPLPAGAKAKMNVAESSTPSTTPIPEDDDSSRLPPPR